MKKVKSTEEINDFINSDIAIVYFTGLDCGACEAIKFKVEDMIKKYPKIKACEISGEKYPKIAAEFGIFSLPILILYVDKKETIRTGRNVSMLDLEKDIDRYYNMIFN